MDNVEETRLENLSHHARTTSFVDVVRYHLCLGIGNRSQSRIRRANKADRLKSIISGKSCLFIQFDEIEELEQWAN